MQQIIIKCLHMMNNTWTLLKAGLMDENWTAKPLEEASGDWTTRCGQVEFGPLASVKPPPPSVSPAAGTMLQSVPVRTSSPELSSTGSEIICASMHKSCTERATRNESKITFSIFSFRNNNFDDILYVHYPMAQPQLYIGLLIPNVSKNE